MLSGRSGQALVLVLLMTTFIFLVGSAALALSLPARRNAALDVFQKQAYYIAEAGVERVLAKIREDPGWVRDELSLGEEYDFLASELNGESSIFGGEFEEIKIKKTGEFPLKVSLNITSTGKYREARKKINVDVNVDYLYAEEIFRGIWTRSLSGLKLSHGVEVTSDVMASDGEVILPAGTRIKGDVYSKKKVVLEEKQGNEFVELEGDIFVQGIGLAAGDYALEIKKGAVINNAYVENGKVYISEGNKEAVNPLINGKIYVKNIDQLDEEWREKNPGKWEVKPELSCGQYIPPYPNLLTGERLKWYEENADFRYEGQGSPIFFDTDMLSNLNGLYFVNGDAIFSGEYSGNGTFVVNGDVTFKKFSGRDKASLVPENNETDCLAILCTGVFETRDANGEIHALLYSSSDSFTEIKNKTEINGAIVIPNIKSNGYELNFVYDDALINRYSQNLIWTTCIISIEKWSS